ncbi:SDR family NAD(P)-dependent oxidoreductase [Paenibacillus thermotolerans]|uniref:SDR family NAD(P)-dependent oxidoreductase n=1 Tax=Paenibacillus thermotolerans TaxID=3027807 RepID=UPI0023686145|nr:MULTISPECIES: SDR family NAD(P)-dependent oxidoreductase [unclassified Paenibacillus]
MNTLQDKVIFITGALGTLGRSAVSMFLSRGASVAACDLAGIENCPDSERLAEQYGKERFLFVEADVCDENSVISIVSEIERKFGRLDGSYHNVYTNVWKPALELTLAEWEASIRGTLTSTFIVCKHVLPLMIRSGGGSIVNTSSILGQIVSPGCLAYGAAKAGVNQFTKVLAADYARYGIRANALVPGDFKPDDMLAGLTEQAKETIRSVVWLGRSGRADEINEMAAFLLSDASSYITGALLPVDGGFHQ